VVWMMIAVRLDHTGTAKRNLYLYLVLVRQRHSRCELVFAEMLLIHCQYVETTIQNEMKHVMTETISDEMDVVMYVR